MHMLGHRMNVKALNLSDSLFFLPLFFTATVLGISSPALSSELPEREGALTPSTTLASTSLAQIVTVDELSDVRTTDWAHKALEKLVNRYNCLVGYPDGSFLGNQPLSRFEFAAGLHACLDSLRTQAIPLSEEELQLVERLQSTFAADLLVLDRRLNSLDTRIERLEDQKFSPSTKLSGQLVVGLQGRTDNAADFFPVDGVRDLEDPGTNVNLITNAQLSLVSKLSPRSFFLIGLAGGDGSTAPRLNNDVTLSFEADSNNNVEISDLSYRHIIGDSFSVIAGTNGVNAVNVFRGTNRVEGAGFGSLSAFAQRNPVINVGAGSGGIGFDWQINPRVSLQSVYSASNASSDLFGDGTSVAAQLVATPVDELDIAFHYVNAHSPFGVLGTGVGDDQVAVLNTADLRVPLNTNAFGATVAWDISPNVTLGGWFGYTNSSISDQPGNVETTNWMTSLTVSDLFGEGNLAGLYVGQPPKITNSDLPLGSNIPNLLAGGPGSSGGQPGTTTHIESFFRYSISKNVFITPGVIAILNPANTPDSESIVIGVIRTTMVF